MAFVSFLGLVPAAPSPTMTGCWDELFKSELLRKSDLLCRDMSLIFMKITWIVVLKILRILVKKVFKNI